MGVGFPGAQMVKSLPAVWETRVQSLGGEDPLERGMATHSSIPAWRITWTEEPGGAWQATVHGVCRESTRLSGWHCSHWNGGNILGLRPLAAVTWGGVCSLKKGAGKLGVPVGVHFNLLWALSSSSVKWWAWGRVRVRSLPAPNVLGLRGRVCSSD